MNKKLNEIARMISVHFANARSLFQRHIRLKKKYEKLESFDESEITTNIRRQNVSIWKTKGFAILLETILAFRGFEYFFISIEIPFDFENYRLILFFPAFLVSFLFIELTLYLLKAHRRLNIVSTVHKIALALCYAPLTVIPFFNYFGYQYFKEIDPSGQHEIYIILAGVAFVINVLLVYLINNLIFTSQKDVDMLSTFKEKEQLEKKIETIHVSFRKLYLNIERHSFFLFEEYQKRKKEEKSDLNGASIPLKREYLIILQETFNDIDFYQNRGNETKTGFENWWQEMSETNYQT